MSAKPETQSELAELPPLPNTKNSSEFCELWALISKWTDAKPGSEAKQTSAAVDAHICNMLQDYARAALLAADGKAGGEAVAWRRWENGMWVYYETAAWPDAEPLYAAPPQQQQAAPGAVQDGFVMVPLEPTKEMLKAAVMERYGSATYRCTSTSGCETMEAEVAADYAAMIAAAPKAVVQDGWMPIETVEEAPELPGSTPVLAFSTNQITSIQPLVFVRELLEISKNDPDDHCLFTHWMPLPSAPKEKD